MASILMQLGIDQYTDRFKTWIDKNYAKKGEGGGGLTYNDQDDKIYDGETAIELSADTTTTTREMTVSSAIGDYAAGAKIAEGTDVMTILANIFEKTLGISVTQPSASLTKSSGDEAGTYEYGTPIDAVLLASLNTGEYKGSG